MVSVILPLVVALLILAATRPVIEEELLDIFKIELPIKTDTSVLDVTDTSPDTLVALAVPAVLLPVMMSEVQEPVTLVPTPEVLFAIADLLVALDAVLLPAVLLPTSVNVPPV